MKRINFFLAITFFFSLFLFLTKSGDAKESGQFILKTPKSILNVAESTTIEIHTKTSTPVNAAQVTINYPADIFEVISINSIDSSFTIKAEETINSGTVKIARGNLIPHKGRRLFSKLQVIALKKGQMSMFKVLEPNTLIMTSNGNYNIFTDTEYDIPNSNTVLPKNKRETFLQALKEFIRLLIGR